mmetsp:Transcript_28863/g.46717  ORF Transcript_28863/g.46717 Transcript_28863/m.46717 type:complete len:203 (+) Transcript_28863:2795-3403(+)
MGAVGNEEDEDAAVSGVNMRCIWGEETAALAAGGGADGASGGAGDGAEWDGTEDEGSEAEGGATATGKDLASPATRKSVLRMSASCKLMLRVSALGAVVIRGTVLGMSLVPLRMMSVLHMGWWFCCCWTAALILLSGTTVPIVPGASPFGLIISEGTPLDSAATKGFTIVIEVLADILSLFSFSLSSFSSFSAAALAFFFSC